MSSPPQKYGIAQIWDINKNIVKRQMIKVIITEDFTPSKWAYIENRWDAGLGGVHRTLVEGGKWALWWWVYFMYGSKFVWRYCKSLYRNKSVLFLNAMEGLSSVRGATGEKIKEPQYEVQETTRKQLMKEKWLKGNEQYIWKLWHEVKRNNIGIIRVPEENKAHYMKNHKLMKTNMN